MTECGKKDRKRIEQIGARLATPLTGNGKAALSLGPRELVHEWQLLQWLPAHNLVQRV